MDSISVVPYTLRLIMFHQFTRKLRAVKLHLNDHHHKKEQTDGFLKHLKNLLKIGAVMTFLRGG